MASQSMSSRYSLFPIRDEESFNFYKRQEASVWSANEMDFIRDKKDYDLLDRKYQNLIKKILGFFAPGDGLISNNLALRFIKESQTYEEQAFFIAQLYIELIHAETYGMTIHTLITDDTEREKIFRMVDDLKAVKKKADWMEKYMIEDGPKDERFVAFACAEGIFFCVLFAIIFWFRSKGILQNLIFSNEMIARDESLHRDYGIHMYHKYKSKDLSKGSERILQIVEDAVEIEKEFIDFLLPENMDDLTPEALKVFTESVADNLLVSLGLEAKYNSKNPFSWMNDISMQRKANFYEVRVGSYKQFSMKDALDWRKRTGETHNSVDAVTNPELVDF